MIFRKVFFVFSVLFISTIFISIKNFLLFHTTIEFLGVLLACGIMVMAINTQILNDKFILFLGIGYGFIGCFDFLHVLAYQGMGVFKGDTANLATQLWIIARYLESLTLFFSLFFLNKHIKSGNIFYIYLSVVIILLASVFVWEIFPDCFLTNSGLTLFKIRSEYLIILVMIMALILLVKKRKFIDKDVFEFLAGAFFTSIIAEMYFTIYSSVYDLAITLGHFFKLCSIYFVYKAVIETNLIAPYTKLIKIKTQLKISEKFFLKIFNTTPSMMAIINAEGIFLDINESWKRITGYQKKECIGKTIKKLGILPKSEWEKVEVKLQQGTVNNLEVSFQIKTCVNRVGLLSLEKICLGVQQCFLAVVNDITELRQYEKELLRLDQLNLVGEMAASIAHEIRNPMTTVRGFIQLMQNKIAGKDQFQDELNLMIEELDRANGIINEYLFLAKTKEAKLQLHNLNLIIKVLYPLINSCAIKEDKSISLFLGEIPDILLDEKKVRQLILNLTKNGIEAMEVYQNLTISTFLKDGKVVLAIKNQGPEIPAHIMEKLGTPFFTTKNNGTGLGLSVCYNIAKQHDAQIKVVSNPRDTTFFVYFPIKTNSKTSVCC